MIDIDELKPWLIGLAVILVSGFAWYFLLQHGNARIEARCLAEGGKVLQRPGQVSYCLTYPQVTATTMPNCRKLSADYQSIAVLSIYRHSEVLR